MFVFKRSIQNIGVQIFVMFRLKWGPFWVISSTSLMTVVDEEEDGNGGDDGLWVMKDMRLWSVKLNV